MATPALADPQVVPFGQLAEIPGAAGAEVGHSQCLAAQRSQRRCVVFRGNGQGSKRLPDSEYCRLQRAGANSSTYAVLKGNEPDGLPNQPLAPGTQIHGRLYFDVKGGTAPDSVVYRDAGGTDKVVWKS